ncbi:MAG TPA: hypothetical protein VGC58_00785 [Candidatus Paceibacterota bacterium]
MNLSTTTNLISEYAEYARVPEGLVSSLSGDLGVSVIAFIALLGISYYFGRAFIISIILAFYPASMLFKMSPFAQKMLVLSGNLVVLNNIAIFLVFLVPLTIIINRFIFTASDYGRGDNILKLAGLSVAFLILMVLFSYNLVSYDLYHNFGPQIDQLFGSTARQFYWFLAPLAIMAIM